MVKIRSLKVYMYRFSCLCECSSICMLLHLLSIIIDVGCLLQAVIPSCYSYCTGVLDVIMMKVRSQCIVFKIYFMTLFMYCICVLLHLLSIIKDVGCLLEAVIHANLIVIVQ